MTEEEYFRKNYPDSCYGDRPLSPHWDFFEEGVEFGERQSEKKIEELKKENAELKEKLTAIRNAKDKYDMSKDKSVINAFGAEYTLFCDLERILEDWQEDDKLTNAKEHIRTLISCLIDWVQEGDKDYCYIEDAEQFLSKED